MADPSSPSPNVSELDIVDDKAEQPWQKLSPIAILYFTASSLKHLVGNMFYLIPVVALNYKNIVQHPYIWIPGLFGLLTILVCIAIVSFKVYRFRLTDSNVEIRSGIFSKKHLNLPFERVQNVKIEQPIYYRISGHACLQLDTAGSAKNEAKIIALKQHVAEKLKLTILQQAKSDTSDDLPHKSVINKQGINEEVTLNTRRLSDLVIHGITSNRIWIFLGGLAPFFDDIINTLGDKAKNIGIDFGKIFSLQTHSFLELGLYALTLTLLIMLMLVSFSVLGSIISFYGYTLNKRDDKYIRRSGLLTKHEVNMALSRLQMVVRKQDWLDVILKRINLKFEQNNTIGHHQDASSATSNKILVPSITENECEFLINDAYPKNSLSQLITENKFTTISKHFIFRHIIFFIFPLWLISTTLLWLRDKPILVALTTAIFIILSLLVYLRWKRWGYARDKQFIYIRKGLIGVDYYCFPAFKAQQIKFLQNVLMKRRHLATVQFVLASGTLKIPYINDISAQQLIDECLFEVESTNQSWM